MLHIPSLQVLQYYTFLTAVVKCSTGVPLKRECEALEYLAVLSPQYISVSVCKPKNEIPSDAAHPNKQLLLNPKIVL